MNKLQFKTIILAIKYYDLNDLSIEDALDIINSHLDLSNPKEAYNQIAIDCITFGTEKIEKEYDNYITRQLQK